METPHLSFSVAHSGQRTNGAELDVSKLRFRLYENGDLVLDDIGELTFSLRMTGRPLAVYEYQVDAVLDGLASEKSEPVAYDFFPPAPPVISSVLFVG